MKRVVDVINFNADASCLECIDWFEFLEGGRSSIFFKWLNLYVELNKKAVLGLPGATLADVAQHNPEAIELIRANPQIFELVLRPFSHDNALLRTRYGFERNLEFGIRVVEKLFGVKPKYFLPPEFMLNSEQVYVLSQNGIKGTFVNPDRFSKEAKTRIPKFPYEIRGVFGSHMNCIPFYGKLTKAFLEGIHFYNAHKWNEVILEADRDISFCWRDGESAFLIPDTLEREKAWLKSESEGFERVHMSDLELQFKSGAELEKYEYQGYPFHSFAPWLKEMRMIGFANKVAKIEEILEKLSEEKVHHWLQVINSDILSSVEKDSPKIEIQNSKSDQKIREYRIWRTERAFEGEDYLTLLKESEKEKGHAAYSNNSDLPHIKKFKSRMEFLSKL